MQRQLIWSAIALAVCLVAIKPALILYGDKLTDPFWCGMKIFFGVGCR